MLKTTNWLIEKPNDPNVLDEDSDDDDDDELYQDKKVRLQRCQAILAEIERVFTLSVFGFNSAKFDLKIMLGYMVVYADSRDLAVRVLKRGTAYFSIQIGNLLFKGTFTYSYSC